MKKLLIIFGIAFVFAACENKQTSEETEVIDSDTVSTTYEVEREVVEMDTTIDVDTTTNVEDIEVETP